jgi:DNA-binding MarR family transcriptional regulator
MRSDDPLDQVGPALSTLRRRTRTRPRGNLLRNLLLYLVSDAGEITVGELAVEMGVAQPVASRTVAAAVEDGLVQRISAPDDRRKALLVLTDQGRAERDRFAAEQRDVFEKITATWSRQDRLDFATFLVRYARDSAVWAAGAANDS